MCSILRTRLNTRATSLKLSLSVMKVMLKFTLTEQTSETNWSTASIGCNCFGSMCRCAPGYYLNEESSMCDGRLLYYETMSVHVPRKIGNY